MNSRDPKIDPMPGDVLCSATGSTVAIVDATDNARVRYRIQPMNGRVEHLESAIDEWRRLAARPTTAPRATRLAELEAEREALSRRLADIDERLAFLRGAQ